MQPTAKVHILRGWIEQFVFFGGFGRLYRLIPPPSLRKPAFKFPSCALLREALKAFKRAKGRRGLIMCAAVIRNYTRTKLSDCKTESSTEEEEEEEEGVSRSRKIISSALWPQREHWGMFLLSFVKSLQFDESLKLLHKSLLFFVDLNFELISSNNIVCPPPATRAALCHCVVF